MKERDVRTLCYRCFVEMHNAGYILIETKNRDRSACDKCYRQGKEYIKIK